MAVAAIAASHPWYRGAPFVFDVPRIVSNLVYLNSFVGHAALNPVYWTLAIRGAGGGGQPGGRGRFLSARRSAERAAGQTHHLQVVVGDASCRQTFAFRLLIV